MAEKILFIIAGSVLKNIGSKAVNEIALAWGFKTRLDKLNNTVNMIKDVLLDAEEKQVESHTVRGWLKRLTTAIYAADDLFDEFATVASQRVAMTGNKLSKEVSIFFSTTNQIAFAINMSNQIKKIRMELDEIAEDSKQFGFVLRHHDERIGVGRQPRDQTHSYIASEEVIGREFEKNTILNSILSSSTTEEQAVSIIPLVGIGGLGKTALAQLIYNDDNVVNQFELRLWVCVSVPFDIKEIVKKILMSARTVETPNLDMDQLQGQLRKEIGARRYLLVLDDVWNEDKEEWLRLLNLLKFGGIGSKVLITTRSRDVAKITGTGEAYELAELSDEKSWALFEKLAFKQGESAQMPNLVKMGKAIVSKCRGVPLAIRTLGSSLYGAAESKWLKFEGTSNAELPENQNVMASLKLSYHDLWSPLKNCFAYCALFRKNFIFEKETLIDLWMAEGYICQVNKNQEAYEVGEEYFMMLLQRCFFQDITKDEWGNVKSCKMHDLIHDLALEVAGAEAIVAKIGDNGFNEESRHLSFDYRLPSTWECPSSVQGMKHLRTILLPEQVRDGSEFNIAVLEQIISKFKCLRVLDLHNLGLKSIPESIGKLIHLRYLDLSNNPIERLPLSITYLRNLQTLKLYNCSRLDELPKNMRKLTNLQTLDLCQVNLDYMPHGLGELTSLRKLSFFVVTKGVMTWLNRTAELKELKNLNNLRGSLSIKIAGKIKDPTHEAKEADLGKKHCLTHLAINVAEDDFDEDDSGSRKHDEALLEGLKPHPNIEMLEIEYYRGEKLPNWAIAENLSTTLPNLIKIILDSCGNCVELPFFSKLPLLRSLELRSVESVEYMESGPSIIDSTLFFPALERLQLGYMNNLKGWWKDGEEIISTDDQRETLFLANLTSLDIQNCPNLASFPLCPNVERFVSITTNHNLLLQKLTRSSSIRPFAGSSSIRIRSKLTSLGIGDVDELISLPEDYLSKLCDLSIHDQKFQSLSTLTDVLKSLSSLRTLTFSYCDELDLSCNGQNDDGMPWEAMQSLSKLSCWYLPKLVNLPTGLQHLTNLRSLQLVFNENLVALPEWISCLSSLQEIKLLECLRLKSLPKSLCSLTSLNVLQIAGCPKLTQRCRGPHGADWYKIRHIPHLTVLESLLDYDFED